MTGFRGIRSLQPAPLLNLFVRRGYLMGVWRRLHFLFDTDDGALYDVRVTALDKNSISAAFDFLLSRAKVNLDVPFWHRVLDREERLGA
jgi:hypothetical protein